MATPVVPAIETYYCHYCALKEGESHQSRAQTMDDLAWICDSCFYFSVCEKAGVDPCRDKCVHRPELITKWVAMRRREEEDDDEAPYQED